MSNTIKLKRGSGSDPSASDLSVGEIAIRTDSGKLFTKKDNGSVAEISGSGGIDDGDKGDITVSNGGDTFTIDSGVVTSAKIADGTIVNADVNASAAIAGTKISPDFGSQNVATTGTLGSSDITITNASPKVNLVDSGDNPDYYIQNHNGVLKFHDSTNSTNRLVIHTDGHLEIGGNTDFGAGIDVTGNITTTGAVSCVNANITGELNLMGNTAAKYMDFNIGSNLLNIRGTTGGDSGHVTMATFARTGSVVLNFNGVNHFATNSGGVAVTGNMTVTGTVDGVDIAARNTLFGGLTSSSGVLTNGVTATTQSASDNSTKVATTAYTDTAISNLVDSAPGTLNTLNELAAALGDDANFSTTVTNSIATKLPLAGGTMTGDLTITRPVNTNNTLTLGGSGAYSTFIKLLCAGAGGTQIEASGRGDGGNKLEVKIGSNVVGFFDESNFNVKGNILLTGDATTTNQDRTISFTGFDKESTSDFTDNAFIRHTTNTGGHSGSVLNIASKNDSNDGIAFETHASSQLKHNGYTIWDANNDGSGSGLDADLLDGQEGSYYRNAGNLNAGTIPAARVPTLNQNTTGSAATLTTARTIAGVSFDGSANISLNNNAITNGAGYITSSGTSAGFSAGNASNLNSGTLPTARLGTLPQRIGLNTSVGNTPASRNAFLALGDSDTGVAQNGDGQLEFWANNQEIMNLDTGEIEVYKQLRPGTDSSFSLGTSSHRWSNLYADTLYGDGSNLTNLPSQTDQNFTNADHSKLDGIESGATADQSNSEIKTAYEANSNTNAFTDALLSKLNGIAASATNVTNTNQLTNGAGFITATLTNEQVQDIVGGMVSSNTESGITVTYQDGDGTLDFSVASQTDNNFTNADHSKLDGIESGATADQSASEILTLIKTVDGSGSGLDADTLDGISIASLLRSDTADTASGDISFQGGAGAVSIQNNSDIRFDNGNWTGNAVKIQHHSNYLYIGVGSNGLILREDGTNRVILDGDGHFTPATDSTYDLGINARRWRNLYADTLYGDGSNLTGISAGATGGGSDEVFYENSQTVTTNYTITNGKNAMAAGPITINSGVTVTVGSGETLTIV